MPRSRADQPAVPATPAFAALGPNAVRPARSRIRPPRPRPDARPFDPRHPGRLASGHRRALVLVLEAFARLFATSLAGQLRTTASVMVHNVDQRDYGSLVAASSEPTWIAALSLGPVSGLGVLDISIPLAMTLVDRLLGGAGTGPHPERALTDLEGTLLTHVAEIALGELATAFAPLCTLEPEILRIETQPELLKAAAQPEAYAVTVLSLELPDTGAPATHATLALPLAGLEPAMDAFLGGGHRAGVREEPPATVADHLLDVGVDVTLRFDPVSIPAAGLVSLSEGQLLRLGHRTNSPLSVDVEGTSFLAAKPGRLGRRLAFAVVDPTSDLGAATA